MNENMKIKYFDEELEVYDERRVVNKNTYSITLNYVPSPTRPLTVENGKTLLTETAGVPSSNQYVLDRENGLLLFNEAMKGKVMVINYSAIGLWCISADKVYTNVDNKGEIIETLEDLMRENREIIESIKTVGDASTVITQLQADIDSALGLADNIMEGSSVNEELTKTITSSKGANTTLSDTISNADAKINEMNTWVNQHGDIVNLDNRVDTVEIKIPQISEQLDNMTNNFVTIEEFGGIADGITDCTMPLQLAINKAIIEKKVLKLKGKIFIDSVTILDELSIISDKAEIITSSHDAVNDKNYKPIIAINSNNVNISDLTITSTADSISYLDYYNSISSTAKCSNRLAFEVNGNNINVSNVTLNNVYGIRDYRNSNCNYNNIVINGCEMGIFEYGTNNNVFSNIIINMNDTGLNMYYHPYYFKAGAKNITINNTTVSTGEVQIRDVFHFNDSDETDVLMDNITVNGATIIGNFLRLDQLRKVKNVVFNNVVCTVQEYIHINGVDVSDITFNSCDIKIQAPTGSVIRCDYDNLNMVLNHCKITFITNPDSSLFESVGVTLNNCILKCIGVINKFTVFKPLSNNRELVMNGGKIIAPNGLALINGSLTDKVIINNVYFNIANQTAQYIAYISANSNWFITNCVFNSIRNIFQDGVSTTSKNINNTIIS